MNESRRSAIKKISAASVMMVYGCGGADDSMSSPPPNISVSNSNSTLVRGSESSDNFATKNQTNSVDNDSQNITNTSRDASVENPKKSEGQSTDDAVTLLTPPRIATFNGNASIAGAVLKAISATWMNEVPVERTGTVKTYTSRQITLDNAASNMNDAYAGMWVVVITGYDFAQPCGMITAYNGTSRIATIDFWRDGSPVVGKEWRIIKQYPIQRKWQWKRNGVPIEGQSSATYTTQDADTGKQITVTETAGFISPSNNGLTIENITKFSTATSHMVEVLQPTKNIRLIQQDDFEYQGSFRLPDAGSGGRTLPFFSDAAFFIRNNGGVTTAVVRGHTYTSCVAEVSLNVSPSKTGGYANLPVAQLVQPINNVPLPLLSSTVDLAKAGTSRGNSSFIGVHGTTDGRILFNYTGGYNKGPWLHFRRAKEISDQSENSVEGPFTIIDPNFQSNTRWTTGWYCDIPVEWQESLGGDVIAGSGVPYISISVNTLLSHGPSAIVFNSKSIDSTLATKNSGVARGGTLSPASIQLAESASNVDGFYVGHFLNVPDCYGTSQLITAYNGASKTATVETWDIVPTAGTPYNTIPYVTGRQLIGYPSSRGLEVGSEFGKSYPIWNFSTAIGGMCIPAGSDSLLIFAKTGDGLFTYSQSEISGDFGVQRAGYRIFDPGNPEPGPHSQSSFLKVYSYDMNELAEVKNRLKSFSEIKPQGVFTLSVPSEFTSLSRRSIRGVSYDKLKRQVLIAESTGPSASPVIHVFKIKRII